MPNTLVQTNVSTPGSSNTFTCPFTSATAKGNLLIVQWRRAAGASTTTVTDSLGNTWVVVYDTNDGGGSFAGGWAYCVNATRGGVNSVNINFTGGPYGGGVVTVAEFNGPNAVRGITGVAFGNGTGPAAGPLNVATGDLAIGVYEAATAGTLPTAGSGYTIAVAGLSGGSYYGAIQYETVTGSPLSSIFTATATQWTSGMAAFYTLGSVPSYLYSNFNNVGGGTTATVAITVQAVGDFLLAVGANDTPSSLSDTAGNTWIPILGPNQYTSAWYAFAKSKGSTTLTFTYPTSQSNILVVAAGYSGVNAQNPLDVDTTVGVGTNATTYNSGNMVTRQANELYVMFGNNYGSNAPYSTGSASVQRINNPNNNTSIYLFDRNFATVGTYTETGTFVAAPFGGLFINLTLRPAQLPAPPPAGGGSGLGYDFRYRF